MNSDFNLYIILHDVYNKFYKDRRESKLYFNNDNITVLWKKRYYNQYFS